MEPTSTPTPAAPLKAGRQQLLPGLPAGEPDWLRGARRRAAAYENGAAEASPAVQDRARLLDALGVAEARATAAAERVIYLDGVVDRVNAENAELEARAHFLGEEVAGLTRQLHRVADFAGGTHADDPALFHVLTVDVPSMCRTAAGPPAALPDADAPALRYPNAVFATEAEYDASVADAVRRIQSGEIPMREPELDDADAPAYEADEPADAADDPRPRREIQHNPAIPADTMARAQAAVAAVVAARPAPHQQPVGSPAAELPTGWQLSMCQAGRDGDCSARGCPQLRDDEPRATGRFCPLPGWDEEDDEAAGQPVGPGCQEGGGRA